MLLVFFLYFHQKMWAEKQKINAKLKWFHSEWIIWTWVVVIVNFISAKYTSYEEFIFNFMNMYFHCKQSVKMCWTKEMNAKWGNKCWIRKLSYYYDWEQKKSKKSQYQPWASSEIIVSTNTCALHCLEPLLFATMTKIHSHLFPKLNKCKAHKNEIKRKKIG